MDGETKEMKKVVAYTAIINPKEPFGITDNIDSLRMKSSNLKVDCICFTNNPEMESTPDCKIIHVPSGDDACRVAKEIKFFPHRFLPEEYDASIWIDGKMNAMKRLDKISKELLSTGVFFAKKHDKRKCVYTEAAKAAADNKDNPEVISRQVEKYKKEGYPENNGLIASGIIFRKHKDEHLIECQEAWWQEVTNHSRRDQISFPYAAWKTNFSYDLIPHKYSGDNWLPYFLAWGHRIKGNRKTRRY